MSTPIKVGDPVTGACQDVGNLPVSMLGLDSSGNLKHVAGDGKEAPGMLLLSGRKATYQADFGAQGLSVCDDGPQLFAKAGTLLRLRLKLTGGAYVVTTGSPPVHYLSDATRDPGYHADPLPSGTAGSYVVGAVADQSGRLLVSFSNAGGNTVPVVRYGAGGAVDTTLGVVLAVLGASAAGYQGVVGVRPGDRGDFAVDAVATPSPFTWCVVDGSGAGQQTVVAQGSFVFDRGAHLALLPGGGFVGVAQNFLANSVFYVSNADGTLRGTIDPGTFWYVQALVAQPDGAVVFAGIQTGTGNLLLGQYSAGGGLDFLTTVAAPLPDFVMSGSVAVGSAGKILAAFLSGVTSSVRTVTLLQFNADGTPDAGFGSGGMASAPYDGPQAPPATAGVYIAAQAP